MGCDFQLFIKEEEDDDDDDDVRSSDRRTHQITDRLLCLNDTVVLQNRYDTIL